MPVFTAVETDADPLHRPAYELTILGPWTDPQQSPPWTSAIVIETTHPEGFTGCSISTELALAYDPTIEEGEILPLVLVSEELDPETNETRTHKYVIGFPVKFYSGRIQLIRISTNFLLGMFEIEKVQVRDSQRQPYFAYLKLKLRKCVAYPSGPADSDTSTSVPV